MTHVLIAVATFYPDIADTLVKGAVLALERADTTFDVVEVPGAFEIPAAIRFAMNSNAYDGYIALGCVIRGETSHYDYVCGESARALMDLSVNHDSAIGYGILTVESMQQAILRADIAEGNKGDDAASACLRMIQLKQIFSEKMAGNKR